MKHSRSNNCRRSVGDAWAKPLAEINSKLVRGVLRVHRERLYYQSSTFPPKWNRGQAGYCNRFDYALKLNAIDLVQLDVYKAVLAIVLDIDRELLWGRWQWPEVKATAPPLAVSDWIVSFEVAYWQKHERTSNRKYLYDKHYGGSFNKLKQNAALTEKLLLDTLNQVKAESRYKLTVSQHYGALADHANIDSACIRLTGKGWTLANVSLRDLPTDEQAWATYESLRVYPEYQSGFLLILLYGIRPHELVYAEPSGLNAAKPYISIVEGKTGPRDALMLRGAGWLDVQWNGIVPAVELNRQNGSPRSHVELGSSITKQYQRRGMPGTLYDYRHLYAVRGFSQSKPIGMMARSMGHSETVHRRTYQATINAEAFQAEW